MYCPGFDPSLRDETHHCMASACELLVIEPSELTVKFTVDSVDTATAIVTDPVLTVPGESVTVACRPSYERGADNTVNGRDFPCLVGLRSRNGRRKSFRRRWQRQRY